MDDEQINVFDWPSIWRELQRHTKIGAFPREEPLLDTSAIPDVVVGPDGGLTWAVPTEVGFGPREEPLLDMAARIRAECGVQPAVGAHTPATHSPEAGETIARAIRWHR